MQQRETLAQLICRTVLEFEQRQAQELQQHSHRSKPISSSNITVANQTLNLNKSKAKQIDRKNQHQV